MSERILLAHLDQSRLNAPGHYVTVMLDIDDFDWNTLCLLGLRISLVATSPDEYGLTPDRVPGNSQAFARLDVLEALHREVFPGRDVRDFFEYQSLLLNLLKNRTPQETYLHMLDVLSSTTRGDWGAVFTNMPSPESDVTPTDPVQRPLSLLGNRRDANLMPQPEPASDDWNKVDDESFEDWYANFESMLDPESVSLLDTDPSTSACDCSWKIPCAEHEEFRTRLRDRLERGAHDTLQDYTFRCFVTDDTTLGAGPDGLREGDEVFVLYGTKFPFVLLPVKGQDAYQLIGWCYISGLYGADIFRTVSADAQTVRLVCIVAATALCRRVILPQTLAALAD